MNEKKRVHNFSKHNELGFEISTIGKELNCDEISLQLVSHTHDYYSILFILSGEGEHYIDCEKYLATNNSFIFISPGQCHAYDPRLINGYEISFKAEFFSTNKPINKIYDFPFFHTSMGLPFLQLPEHNPRTSSLITSIYNEFKSNEFGKLALLRSSLEILLIELSRLFGVDNIDFSATTQINTVRVRELECLIDSHFLENRSVSFYAEKLNISSRHLNNITKNQIDCSISDMITKRLMSEAKRMLLYSDDTVTQIAMKLNFSDKAYFHRLFKNRTNYTPEGFREKFLKVHHKHSDVY